MPANAPQFEMYILQVLSGFLWMLTRREKWHSQYWGYVCGRLTPTYIVYMASPMMKWSRCCLKVPPIAFSIVWAEYSWPGFSWVWLSTSSVGIQLVCAIYTGVWSSMINSPAGHFKAWLFLDELPQFTLQVHGWCMIVTPQMNSVTVVGLKCLFKSFHRGTSPTYYSKQFGNHFNQKGRRWK